MKHTSSTDASLIRSATVCCLMALLPAVRVAAQNPLDPLSAEVPQAFWSIELEEVLTLPDSPGTTSAPRMEFLTTGGIPGNAYILDQRGPIYRFEPAAEVPSPTLVLDVSAAISDFHDDRQTGLRGLAFHPEYNNSAHPGYRKLYTSHSRTTAALPVGDPRVFDALGGLHHYSVLGEWTAEDDGTIDATSYRELMFIEQPRFDHNIGQIGFNPLATPDGADYGNLYVALGDGGGANDPNGMAQNTGQLHGSFLRIDPLATDVAPYTIPDDNPLTGQDDVAEIWAYGVRNPHRFTWDEASGRMLFVDIGQASVEEVNEGRRGFNYGWDVREGTFDKSGGFSVSPLPEDHAADIYTYPLAQYDHLHATIGGSSWAIVGGPVYRGTSVPQLTGMYLFGDFAANSGPIFAVDVDDLVNRNDFSPLDSVHHGLLAPYVRVPLTGPSGNTNFRQVLRDSLDNPFLGRTDLRFGVGPTGDVYVLNKHDGIVRRIAAVNGLIDGDTDRDGDVDADDIAAWKAGFGLLGADWSDGNFDGGKTTDGQDFLALQRNFQPSGIATAVPEPASWALIASCAAVLLLRRNRP